MRWYHRPFNPEGLGWETAAIESWSEANFSLHVDWASPMTQPAYAAEPAYVHNVLGWRDAPLIEEGAGKAGSQISDQQPVIISEEGLFFARGMMFDDGEPMALRPGLDWSGAVTDLRFSAHAEFDFSTILSNGRLDFFVGGEIDDSDRSFRLNADVGVLRLEFGANSLALTNNPFDTAALQEADGLNFLMADTLPSFSDMLIPNIEWGG